jgi:hypothetical protein
MKEHVVWCLSDEHCKQILGSIGFSTGSIADDGELLHLEVLDHIITSSGKDQGYKRYREIIDALIHDPYSDC